MTAFGDCVADDDLCVAYCRNTCLRSLMVSTEPSSSEDWVVSTRNQVGSTTVVNGYETNGWDEYQATSEWNVRNFQTVLAPGGSYVMSFLDANGAQVSPAYHLETWLETPDECADLIGSEDVVMASPATSCDDAVANGDFSTASVSPWKHNHGGHRNPRWTGD